MDMSKDRLFISDQSNHNYGYKFKMEAKKDSFSTKMQMMDYLSSLLPFYWCVRLELFLFIFLEKSKPELSFTS